MTLDDKEKIKELRLQGMGYKAISTIVGLSRDSIRAFCKRNSLAGDYRVVALNVNEKVNKNLLCANCERSLNQNGLGRTRRFCSDECRRIWWKEHDAARNKSKEHTYHYICSCCGKRFSSYGNKKRKYCSHNCYIKDRFWREEDGV